jgi:hypothetical protein
MKMRLCGILSVLLAVLCASALPVPVSAAGGGRPVYAADVANGTYEIEAETLNSSMFRIVACTLTVTDESMSAHVTLSAKGFGKLFAGHGADADHGDGSEISVFSEDGEGRHTFDIPVSALDTPIPVAGWSIKREKWYDYDVVFHADSLPDGVVAKSGNSWILPCAAGCTAAAVIAVFAVRGSRRRKKKQGDAA